LFKRLVSLAPALGVVSRFQAAVDADPGRNTSEPYQVLISAWLAAIEPYERQEPQLFAFNLTTGAMQTACRVFALLPLSEGSYFASRMVAAFAYPAYGE